jgi:hypothetical protein
MPRSRRRSTGRRNQIAGGWTQLPREMLESPPWRVLSLSAHRVLDRVSIELRRHGGHHANGLAVTFDDFEEYGIDRHCIGPAIREAVALGLLEIVRQGRSGNAEYRQSTLYRVTYEMAVDHDPTHEWKRVRTIEQARKLATEARNRPGRRRRTRHSPVGVSPTETSGFSPTENRESPVGVSPTTVVADTPTTLDTLGWVDGPDGGGARLDRPRCVPRPDRAHRPPEPACSNGGGRPQQRDGERGRQNGSGRRQQERDDEWTT